MNYIVFKSEQNISINANRRWDGTIEYSFNNKEWKEWKGKTIINNTIYMRGVNNTTITDCPTPWRIKGENIKCEGNLEALLNYKFVMKYKHPKMESECFTWMFYGCRNLITASFILPLDVAYNCYQYMFARCPSLTASPIFPNFTVAKEAIVQQRMFWNCPIQFININNKLYDINVLKLL